MARWALFAVMAVLALVCGEGVASAAPPVANSVRIADHPDKTRFVIDLTGETPYAVYTLPDPYRIIVDLPEVDWQAPAMHAPGSNQTVKDYRFGLFAAGHSRIVIDLNQPAAIDKTFTLPPSGPLGWRIVIDIKPTTRDAFMADKTRFGTGFQIPVQQAAFVAPKQEPAPAPKKAERRVPVIVVDAGHGGPDPGTISVSGIYEKHVTLAMARELKERLEAGGRYRVVLTRDRDIFIPLRKRVEIARDAGADLFMSLHADAIKDKNIRGLSVYTLSEKASDKEAELLAEKENKADLIAGMDLTNENKDVADILIDLAQRDTLNMSARYASFAVRSLGREVKLLGRTHREASFAVLKAPDVPSVLVEMGYLSNAEEEKLLRQTKYRSKLAQGIAGAIDQYFSQAQKADLP